MNKKLTLILLFAFAFFLYACKKDIDVFVPNPGQTNGADTAWYASITSAMPIITLQSNLQIKPAADSFEVNNTASTIQSANGLQFSFPANSCVNNSGQSISGKVSVQSYLIKKKGDMILMNRPTTSNDNLLVSGGEIYLRILKDTQEINLASTIKYFAKYTDVSISTTMKLFLGDESNPQHFNWLPVTDTANNFISSNTQFYQMYSNKLHWINFDYYYDTTNITRSTVSVNLPLNYTNANTAVYIVFNDFKSVVRLSGDINAKKFTSIRLPNGKGANIVVLSKQANDFYFTHSAITIGSGSNNMAVSLTPIKSSMPDIQTYLSGL